MRVLVTGAGIAGLATAAFLGRSGASVDAIERAGEEQAGYVLGLYPLADPVFRELGVFEEIEAASEIIETYVVADAAGRTIREFDLRPLSARFGPMRGASRADR